jgi:hypothetical protein
MNVFHLSKDRGCQAFSSRSMVEAGQWDLCDFQNPKMTSKRVGIQNAGKQSSYKSDNRRICSTPLAPPHGFSFVRHHAFAPLYAVAPPAKEKTL